jgi:hypothetical protein
MSASISDVAAFISNLVDQTPQKTLSGSLVAARLRSEFPDFGPTEFGYLNLRDFVRRAVPQLAESPHRAGMDVLYIPKTSLQSSAGGVQTSSRPVRAPGFVSLLLNDPRAWKTFANPNSPRNLFVRPDGSELRILPPNSRPGDGTWLQISSISASSLIQMAEEFIGTAPELYRQSLMKTLQTPKWWLTFFEELGSLGLKSKWMAFRRRRIIDEFSKALGMMASELGPSASLTSSEVTSEGWTKPTDQPQRPLTDGVRLPSDFSLRQLAVAAVQRMTDAELRSLNIPLGYLVDALRGNT